MEQLYGSKDATLDLKDLGAGDEGGLMMRAARQYGGRVLEFMNRLDAKRRR